jgi:hypothetical protein
MAYAENNSNFSNLIPLWDRLFGPLCQGPEGQFRVDPPEFASPNCQRLDKLLTQPLLVNAVPVRWPAAPTAAANNEGA